MNASSDEQQRALNTPVTGGFLAAVAFLIWGAFPLLFKQVDSLPGIEVLAHRIVWSCLFMFLLLAISGRLGRVIRLFDQRGRTLWLLLLSALLVSCNWLIFIWAVAHDQVLEASLGYFINPLLNVALGVVFLQERLRSLQWIAIIIASTGVLSLIIFHGVVPWVALGLAVSFGLYGLVRKVTHVDSMTGLAIETLMLLPAALVTIGYLLYLGEDGFFSTDMEQRSWLITIGIMTAIPLILFAAGARRIRLSTLGVLQYLAPTGQFLLAVFIFGELFHRAYQFAFGAIWIALLLYAYDLYRGGREQVELV